MPMLSWASKVHHFENLKECESELLEKFSLNGLNIDTYLMKEENPYHQLVVWFTSPEGEEVVLLREDVSVTDADGIRRNRNTVDAKVRVDVFHGFADNLHYDLKAEHLTAARRVIKCLDAFNIVIHHKARVDDSLELGGRRVFWTIKSAKPTNGDYKQSIRFYTNSPVAHTQVAFTAYWKAREPFVRVNALFEKYKEDIARVLELDLEKKS